MGHGSRLRRGGLTDECLSTLPGIYAEVLEALTLPDPAPQEQLDSPAFAVVRRLPHITIAQAATALDGLNGLGFIRVKYLMGPVSPTRTENTREWITAEGWRELGMTSSSDLQ